MKGLIAAGGRATRLRPITTTLNKHLIPLAGRPMIEHAVQKMADAGIREIAININPGDTEMAAVLGDGSRFGVSLTYLEQTGGPKGVGHIVNNARSWVAGDSFVFYLGDNIVLAPIKPLIDSFLEQQLDCMLTLARVENPNRFGVPEIIDGRIVRVLEKPENPPSPFAVTGIYVYGPAVFDAAQQVKPSPRGEYEISDIHTLMIEQGSKVGYTEVTGWWKDTGKPEDLLEGNVLLLERMEHAQVSPDAIIEPGSVIDGLVSIGPRTRVTADSVIRGPAWIGSDCVIDHAQIGPGVSIGNDSRVSGVRVEKSLLLDTVTLTGEGVIRDSIIGRVTRVQMSQKESTTPMKLLLGDHGVIES